MAPSPQAERVDVSVVVPVLDEEPALHDCHRELARVLSAATYNYQLIFVDDRSVDRSWQTLVALQRGCEHTMCIRLRRHVGQQPALLIGLRFATGRAVVTYDADMQFAPDCVPLLAAKIHDGYDIASGIRSSRARAVNLPSRLAGRLINRALRMQQQDFGAVKAYSRALVNGIVRRASMGTVIPALAYTLSRNAVELPVTHRPRATGRSKWNLVKRVRVFVQAARTIAAGADGYHGAPQALDDLIEAARGLETAAQRVK